MRLLWFGACNATTVCATELLLPPPPLLLALPEPPLPPLPLPSTIPTDPRTGIVGEGESQRTPHR